MFQIKKTKTAFKKYAAFKTDTCSCEKIRSFFNIPYGVKSSVIFSVFQVSGNVM